VKLPFSILKSPGSKTRFIRQAERFVRDQQPKTIVEPFAGSAIVGLTLLDRGCGERLVLAEKDPELRLFFQVALKDADFASRVIQWTHDMSALQPEKRHGFAVEAAERMAKTDPALSVLLRSRLEFNGILRERIAVSTSRPRRNWWPLNLGSSLKSLYAARKKIQVFSDAFEALRRTDSPDSYAFVDPPYTIAKDSPGHKLYRQSKVDHEALVRLLATWGGSWQLTSALDPKMLRWARGLNFDPPLFQQYVFPMRTVNGSEKVELVLSKRSRDAE
jgi:site-specific DNA-adenine methylase